MEDNIQLTSSCKCGHDWGNHEVNSPHTCSECPCQEFRKRGKTNRETYYENEDVWLKE